MTKVDREECLSKKYAALVFENVLKAGRKLNVAIKSEQIKGLQCCLTVLFLAPEQFLE